MKLTKYEHACFTVEKDGKLLVVDPGGFTRDLPDLNNVIGIVITHEHFDHYSEDLLKKICKANPSAKVIAHIDVLSKISDDHAKQAVEAGQTLEIDPFTLDFYGGLHVRVHSYLTPQFVNLGVMIDSVLYYPGDSFVLPESKEVPLLALPVSGPWLRVGEVMDFVLQAKAKQLFFTHDALWSENSRSFERNYIKLAANEAGTEIVELSNPIEING